MQFHHPPLSPPSSFLKSSKGAGLTEMGMVVGLIAIFAIGSVIALGGTIKDHFNITSDSMASGQALDIPSPSSPIETDPEPDPLPAFAFSYSRPVVAGDPFTFFLPSSQTGDIITYTTRFNQDSPSSITATLTENEEVFSLPVDANTTGTLYLSAELERGPQSQSLDEISLPVLTFSIEANSDSFVVGGTNTVSIPQSLTGDIIAMETSHSSGGSPQDKGSVTLTSNSQDIAVPLDSYTSGTLTVSLTLTRDGNILADNLEVSNPVLADRFYNVSDNTSSNIGYSVTSNFSDIFATTYGYQAQYALTSFDKFTGTVNWNVPLQGSQLERTTLAANNNYVAVGLHGNVTQIFNAETGQLLYNMPTNGAQRGIAFDPSNPHMLYTVGEGQYVERINIQYGQRYTYSLVPGQRPSIAIDGNHAYIPAGDQSVRRINLNTMSVDGQAFNTNGTTVHVDVDGNWLYTLSQYQQICRFDKTTLVKDTCKSIPNGYFIPNGIQGLAKIHDGIIYLATGMAQNGYSTFSWNDGQPNIAEIEHVTKTGSEAHNSTYFAEKVFVDDDGVYLTHREARPNGNVRTGGVWYLPH